MKEIGILTFWNVPNYGTFLQAYALQKAIASLDTDYDVKQIAYLEPAHYRHYYAVNNTKFHYGIIDPRTYLNIVKRLFSNKIKELKPFLDYYKDFIPCTEPLSKMDLPTKNFDSVVLGSDIIWDYSIKIFNNDDFLFGNNLNSKNILSYAASFGTVKSETVCPEYVKNSLKKLSTISVRDENSKNLVNQYAGRESTIVCDPTILWDFMNDENISQVNDSKYIIVYGSEFRLEFIKGCVDYAKKNNLQIICLDSLDDNFDWCDKNIKQNELNPFQWLAYFKYAERIFTCTYHGLMFSLIFNKKSVFSPTQFIMDKASSLIDYLELRPVLVDFKTFAEKADWEWDYNKINAKFDTLRQSSLQFLKDNL